MLTGFLETGAKADVKYRKGMGPGRWDAGLFLTGKFENFVFGEKIKKKY